MAKRFNRGDQIGVLHYVTLKVRERNSIFFQDPYIHAVLTSLRQHCDEHPARLIAYVGMPDHLHFINNPRDGKILHFLGQFKPAATLAVRDAALRAGDTAVLDWLHATPDGHPQLWQDGKHSLDLYSDWMIWQKINYIHANPVRRQLVRYPNEYPYSSFSAFYPCEETPLISIERGWWWEEE